jgi:undecaprenyl diphosphate synthase
MTEMADGTRDQLLHRLGIEPQGMPEHVAIIMDGNGRWARAKGWPRFLGHREGSKRVRELTRFSAQIGLKYLTLYAFSKENWNRPAKEVDFLMNLLNHYLKSTVDEMDEEGVQLRVIGDIECLPTKTRQYLLSAIERLKDNRRLVLTLGLSYSGRSEIVKTTRKLLEDVQQGLVIPQDINEDMFSAALDTAGMPDPDLLIRTSGEIRISNFMLWQLAFAEMYFTPVFWPDFRTEHFVEAVRQFQSRERRFGLVPGEQETTNGAEAAEKRHSPNKLNFSGKACSSRDF